MTRSLLWNSDVQERRSTYRRGWRSLETCEASVPNLVPTATSCIVPLHRARATQHPKTHTGANSKSKGHFTVACSLIWFCFWFNQKKGPVSRKGNLFTPYSIFTSPLKWWPQSRPGRLQSLCGNRQRLCQKTHKTSAECGQHAHNL